MSSVFRALSPSQLGKIRTEMMQSGLVNQVGRTVTGDLNIQEFRPPEASVKSISEIIASDERTVGNVRFTALTAGDSSLVTAGLVYHLSETDKEGVSYNVIMARNLPPPSILQIGFGLAESNRDWASILPELMGLHADIDKHKTAVGVYKLMGRSDPSGTVFQRFAALAVYQLRDKIVHNFPAMMPGPSIAHRVKYYLREGKTIVVEYPSDSSSVEKLITELRQAGVKTIGSLMTEREADVFKIGFSHALIRKHGMRIAPLLSDAVLEQTAFVRDAVLALGADDRFDICRLDRIIDHLLREVEDERYRLEFVAPEIAGPRRFELEEKERRIGRLSENGATRLFINYIGHDPSRYRDELAKVIQIEAQSISKKIRESKSEVILMNKTSAKEFADNFGYPLISEE